MMNLQTNKNFIPNGCTDGKWEKVKEMLCEMEQAGFIHQLTMHEYTLDGGTFGIATWVGENWTNLRIVEATDGTFTTKEW